MSPVNPQEVKPNVTTSLNKNISTKIPKQQINDFLQDLVEKFSDGVNFGNMVEAITESMKLVGKLTKLNGIEKKEAVVYLLISIVENTDAGPFEAMDPLLIYTIPKMIDSFIEIEKGKLKFSTKKWSWCCCCSKK